MQLPEHYETPEILDSLDALATLGDADGVAVGGAGCGSRCPLNINEA